MLRNLAALVFLLGACTAVTTVPTPPMLPATAQASPTPYPSSTPYPEQPTLTPRPTYTMLPSATPQPSPLPFPLGVRVPRPRVLPREVASFIEAVCWRAHFYSVSSAHETVITEDVDGFKACVKGTGAGVSR